MSGRLIAQCFLVVLRADRRPELSLPPLITAGYVRGETCLPGREFHPRSNRCRSGSAAVPHQLAFRARPSDDASVTRAARRWNAADLKNSLQLLGWNVLWQGSVSPLTDYRNGSVQVRRYDSFSGQEAQQCPDCRNYQLTTTGLAFACFTTNKIANVLCIERGPVRFTHLERLDQSTRIAKILVPGFEG
jgi:hypothetical protein